MGHKIKTFTLQLEGEYLAAFDEMHLRSNMLIEGYLNEEELLTQLLQIGMVHYRESLKSVETEEFHVC